MQYLKSAPISSVEELMGYSKTRAANTTSFVLFPRYNGEYNRKLLEAQKIMCCHDMRGNYLNDCFINGAAYENAFQLFQFESVHIFCYFSHELLSIPPVSWINCCRTHGLRVMGTLLTEWEAGESRCRTLFATKECCVHLASTMARIAVDHGVDGWLINIENKLETPELVDNLIFFLNALSCAMHETIPNSLIIWYDAVTTEGKLEWQDTINSLNAPFAVACDGLFVNYTWKETTPRQARDYLATMQSEGYCSSKCINAVVNVPLKTLGICDIYFGCDVFGRGTAFGGGFDSHKAVSCAMEAGASVAIFAPGWVLECCCNDDTTIHTFECIQSKLLEASMALWRPIENARKLKASSMAPHSNFPVITSFAQAAGVFVFISGHKYVHWSQHTHRGLESGTSFSRAYYDLSMQDCRFNTDILGQRGSLYECSLCSDIGFIGNGALHLRINYDRPATKIVERASCPGPTGTATAHPLDALPILKTSVVLDLSTSPSVRPDAIQVSIVFAKAMNAGNIRIGARLNIVKHCESWSKPTCYSLDLLPSTDGSSIVDSTGLKSSEKILTCMSVVGISVGENKDGFECKTAGTCTDPFRGCSTDEPLEWLRVTYMIPLLVISECFSSRDSSNTCTIDEIDLIPWVGASDTDECKEASDVYLGAVSVTSASEMTTVLNGSTARVGRTFLCGDRLMCEICWEIPHNYEECYVFCLRDDFDEESTQCEACVSSIDLCPEIELESICSEMSYLHDSALRPFRESNPLHLSAEYFELVGKSRGSSLRLTAPVNRASTIVRSFELVFALQPIDLNCQPIPAPQCCFIRIHVSPEDSMLDALLHLPLVMLPQIDEYC